MNAVLGVGAMLVLSGCYTTGPGGGPCPYRGTPIDARQWSKDVVAGAVSKVVNVTFDDVKAAAPQNYDLLLGPNSCVRVYSDGAAVLQVGWAYFYHRWPIVRTSRISAGVEGSAGAVRINGDSHELFYLGGTRAWIVTSSGLTKDWNDKDVFYRVKDPNLPPEEVRLGSDSEARDFKQRVLDEIAAAHLPDPGH